MVWIYIAIISHFFWGLTNVGQKYLVTNKFKNPYSFYVIFMMFMLIAAAFIPFTEFYVPDTQSFLLIILAAAFWFFGGFPFIKAVQIEDITRVNIWWSMIPVISLFLGWVLIGDYLNSMQLVAFAILLFAAIIAGLHSKGKSMKFSKAFVYMFIASFSVAVYGILLRSVTQTHPVLLVFIWVFILQFVFSWLVILLSKKIRKGIKKEFSVFLLPKVATIIFGIALVDIIANLLNIWALSLGPVALIFSMEAFQMIFVFLLTIGISFFTKINLHEEFNRKNVILKVAALSLGVVGIFLINLS